MYRINIKAPAVHITSHLEKYRCVGRVSNDYLLISHLALADYRLLLSSMADYRTECDTVDTIWTTK